MIQVLAFVIILFTNMQMIFASSTAVFMPTARQVLIIVEGGESEQGPADNDPDILWDLLELPVQTLPGGDQVKILRPPDHSLVLTCLNRVQVGIIRCEFHIKESPFTDLNTTQRWMRYERADKEAAHWYRLVTPNSGDKMIFKTSDGKFEFIVTRQWSSLVYIDEPVQQVKSQ